MTLYCFQRSSPAAVNGKALESPALIEDRAPDRVLVSQESLSEVLRALDELGERTRDIFILYKLEKMKHREIGALYGLSASAVEKYVRKATAHLARRFGRP